jgi:hypothetical protein
VTAAPALSICIPTHHGRAEFLRELLASIEAQPSERLEVCVSDNASQDGSAEVVADFRERSRLPTVYSRNDTNLGLGRNIVRVVEIASGDHVWVVGSDDHLSPDAVAMLLAALDGHPGVSGLTTRAESFSRDMSAPLASTSDAFYPEQRRTTVFSGTHDVLASVGQSFIQMGLNVLHRERLMRAVGDSLHAALAHPLWPQVYLYGEVVQNDPLWVWLPTPLLKARSDNSYVWSTGEAGSNLAAVHAELGSTLAALWREVLPRDQRATRRALTRRAFAFLARPDQIDGIKRREDHSLRSSIRMLVAFTRQFWRLPEFWRGSLPRLLMPQRLVRRYQRLTRRRLPPSRPLAADAMRTRVSADVAGTLPVRSIIEIRTQLTNLGHAPLVSSPPNPVQLSYLWHTPEGEIALEGLRSELRTPLGPGASTTLPLRLLTPWEPGDYRLRIMLVQELVAWFGDVDPANALELDVQALTHDDVWRRLS